MRIIALAGNPNCGKTTLFNLLTGETQHVGNWAGVTVEHKEKIVKLWKETANLVDLPGIYSMTAYTMEENVTRDYLLSGKADIVISLIDGRAIERGLYLTLQLIELGCNIVVAIGMIDEVERIGGQIDCAEIERLIGVPVLAISSRTGRGVQELVERVKNAQHRQITLIRYGDALEAAVSETVSIALKNKEESGIKLKQDSLRFYSLGLLESGTDNEECCKNINQEEIKIKLERIRQKLESRVHCDCAQWIASERYVIIERVIRTSVKLPHLKTNISDQIDKLMLNKFLALPIFSVIMFLVFTVCFGGIGMTAKMWMQNGLVIIGGMIRHFLIVCGVSESVLALVTEGILGGVGSVVTFLPQFALMFLGLTMLEECGYMARAAFLMDRPMKRLGLTGKSFIPLIMGFGCTTPAVMAARTLENERDRRMTILMMPFLSCGAKFPIYALFAGTFFPNKQGIIVGAMYLIGILTAAIYGWFLNSVPLRGGRASFLMEFPPYRMPTLRNLARNTWEKCADFLRKAGTLIFILSVIIWLIQHFDINLRYTANTSESIFNMFGEFIAPVFKPLGFDTSEAAVAVLAGTVTKEAVVAALSVTSGAGNVTEMLHTIFTPLSAVSFLTFCALYAPCISALSSMRRELRSTWITLLAAVTQTAIAYSVALGVYQLGTLWQNLFLK